MSASKLRIQKKGTTSKIVAGIDYSLSCPGMCVHEGDVWSPSNCKYYYLYGVKKWLKCDGNLISEMHKEFVTDIERLDWISSWFVDRLSTLPTVPTVFVENYAYGAHSSSVHILAEGCGLLKYKLWKAGMDVTPLSVTSIKKFASTKGNATKKVMFEAFQNEGSSLSVDLPCNAGNSPLADLIDAYYICKLGFSQNL